MNEHDLAPLVREVTRDVPERSDAEALAALRRAVEQDRRRRRRRAAVLVGTAAAAVALTAWIAIPDDGNVDVASDDVPDTGDNTQHEPSLPLEEDSIAVDADLDAYTGIHPPLVVVSSDPTEIRLFDIFNLDEDSEMLGPHATIRTGFPISWAASGPRGTGVLLVDATDSTAMLVDLETGKVSARWPDTVAAVTSPDHDSIARVEKRPESNVVVLEKVQAGTSATFSPPPGGPQPAGPISWSADGLLAISQDDGSIAVLDPDTASNYADARTLPGPFGSLDWADGRLVATSDCCQATPIITVDPDTGERTNTLDVIATQVVTIDGGGSPWGHLYLDDDGNVHGTQGTDRVLIHQVAQLRW